MMNEYDKELIRTAPSMVKGIAVEAVRLQGEHNISLSLNDVCGMAEFGLALCGQVVGADKERTGKAVAKCAIGGALMGCLISLLIANMVRKHDAPATHCKPLPLPTLDNSDLEAKIDALQRLYQHR